jgi:hypothetical protein
LVRLVFGTGADVLLMAPPRQWWLTGYSATAGES